MKLITVKGLIKMEVLKRTKADVKIKCIYFLFSFTLSQ